MQSLEVVTQALSFFKVQSNVCRDRLVIPEYNQNMMSLRGQASWTKMTSLGGKLSALACHLTK